MQIPEYKAHDSLRVILALLFAILALVALGFWGKDSLHALYLRDRDTPVGLVINATIVLLMLLGLISLVRVLWHYHLEARAMRVFLRNSEINEHRPLVGISAHRLIAERYLAMDSLHRRHARVEHAAMASITVAFEATRLSTARYINNILILAGVFGTIVSLSIALLGASDLLGSFDDTSGMNQVIYGMSTALSTTITAIVCYLFYGLFFLKTQNVQTRFLGTLERVTNEMLRPRFEVSSEGINAQLEDLLNALQSAAEKLTTTHENNSTAEAILASALQEHDARMVQVLSYLDGITRTLNHGFRLESD